MSDGNAMDGHALNPRLLRHLMRDRCIHGAAARAHAYAPRLLQTERQPRVGEQAACSDGPAARALPPVLALARACIFP